MIFGLNVYYSNFVEEEKHYIIRQKKKADESAIGRRGGRAHGVPHARGAGARGPLAAAENRGANGNAVTKSPGQANAENARSRDELCGG